MYFAENDNYYCNTFHQFHKSTSKVSLCPFRSHAMEKNSQSHCKKKNCRVSSGISLHLTFPQCVAILSPPRLRSLTFPASYERFYVLIPLFTVFFMNFNLSTLQNCFENVIKIVDHKKLIKSQLKWSLMYRTDCVCHWNLYGMVKILSSRPLAGSLCCICRQ